MTTGDGADSIGHGDGGTCPHFYRWLGTGGTLSKEQPTRNHRTILATTKALTKTTNCTYRAKKVEGHDQQKFFRRFAPDRCPHFQIRSGAADDRADTLCYAPPFSKFLDPSLISVAVHFFYGKSIIRNEPGKSNDTVGGNVRKKSRSSKNFADRTILREFSVEKHSL